jgi:hypothetical protein
VMFLAGTEKKQRRGGSDGDEFAKPKMHNAPGS